MSETAERTRAAASSDAAASTQADICAEIEELAHAGSGSDGVAATPTQPRLDYPPYRSSVFRHPIAPRQHIDPESIERYAPVFGQRDVNALESDLTIQHRGEPIGERITVAGRVVDGDGKPVANQLVEIWQANAAGRYIHQRDQHPAPLDPNFTGTGRCLTGPDGSYRFTTIKPGPYPWKNHQNAWRPAHIHFSLFGTDFTQRIITQMYFPNDPLFPLDPIFQAVTDGPARDRLVAAYDHNLTQSEWCTGYRWDIVVSGGLQSWTEQA
jgi:protocatechuate 3,4-dioxygenase, beta subunit